MSYINPMFWRGTTAAYCVLHAGKYAFDYYICDMVDYYQSMRWYSDEEVQ